LKSVKSRLSKKLSADSSNLVSPVEVKCSHDLHGLGFISITQEFSDPRVLKAKGISAAYLGKLKKQAASQPFLRTFRAKSQFHRRGEDIELEFPLFFTFVHSFGNVGKTVVGGCI